MKKIITDDYFIRCIERRFPVLHKDTITFHGVKNYTFWTGRADGHGLSAVVGRFLITYFGVQLWVSVYSAVPKYMDELKEERRKRS